MNTERMEELAKLIEALPHTKVSDPFGFNLRDYKHVCGTPACIAGWAMAEEMDKYAKRHRYDMSSYEIFNSAMDKLDLSSAEATLLFDPELPDMAAVTPKEAALAIRNLAAGKDPEDVWEHVYENQRED